jgi:hypothetical protein
MHLNSSPPTGLVSPRPVPRVRGGSSPSSTDSSANDVTLVSLAPNPVEERDELDVPQHASAVLATLGLDAVDLVIPSIVTFHDDDDVDSAMEK